MSDVRAVSLDACGADAGGAEGDETGADTLVRAGAAPSISRI